MVQSNFDGHYRQGKNNFHNRMGYLLLQGNAIWPIKNVSVTYQRMATAMFHDMIHKELDVYIDYMMVKLKMREAHPITLEKFLQRVEKY